MPCTYFDRSDTKNNSTKHVATKTKQEEVKNTNLDTDAHYIRNVAIIAHVDHGKTTLADALLHKAGLLHKERVGNQDTGRMLDTLKDERDRGITIKSAAITLNFNVEDHVVFRKDNKVTTTMVDANELPTTSPTERIDVYIGDLPRGICQEELESWLISQGISIINGDQQKKESSIMIKFFSSRRSYAIVQCCTEDDVLTKLLSLHGSNFFFDDDEKKKNNNNSAIIVELVGNSPMVRLRNASEENKINMPNIDVTMMDGETNNNAFIGRAEWKDMGGVIIQAPGTYANQKLARRAAAVQCLEFLQAQTSNHRHPYQTLNEHKESVDDDAAIEKGVIVDKDATQKQSDDNNNNNHQSCLVPIVMNLIDCPGHIEFNAEVTSALRLSDGALVVVDAIEGKAVQTEQVLIQALAEGVKPVLMINKVDRLFIDRRYTPEEVYDHMQRVIDDINKFIETHQLETQPDQRVKFSDGSVCFGSGYFGWSCSIDSFLNKKDLTLEKRIKMQKYLSKRENFIQYIIKPILRMHRLCGVLPAKKLLQNENINSKISMINEVLSKAGKNVSVDLSTTMDSRKLLKKVMMTWLPAADAIVNMIVAHLPSPVEAQKYRAPMLYSGDIDDETGQGIYLCNEKAPALVYISKMAPSITNNKRLLAFGRVFSGTIHPGDKVRALRTDGSESPTKISSIKLCGIGGKMYTVPSASAGQLVVLEGIDGALDKAGTLTSAVDGKAINHMTFSVAPVVQHSVKPKNKRDLTKMVSGLHQVVNADSTALFHKDAETEEYILAGAGELHIEVLVSTFFQNTGVEIELSEPIVAYRETIQSASSKTALAKSDNKHNRLWFKASPLPDDVIDSMVSGDLKNLSTKDLGSALVKDFGWGNTEAGRIWAVGPEPHAGGTNSVEDGPTCILVDSTYGLQIPDDARSNIVSAFLQVVKKGVMVNAAMRGVRFDLIDAKFHSDSVHRRPNSVVPAASRAMMGAFLLAEPSLTEPIFKVDITGGAGTLNDVYSVLGKRGGIIIDQGSSGTTTSASTVTTSTKDRIIAQVPVRRAFGLSDELRLVTHGHAHTSSSFDGMRLVPSRDHETVVADARTRRKLENGVPVADAFLDKL